MLWHVQNTKPLNSLAPFLQPLFRINPTISLIGASQLVFQLVKWWDQYETEVVEFYAIRARM